MTYEQLMEMQANAGHVSRGYSAAEIQKIPSRIWYTGRTKEKCCHICMEDFKSGNRYKSLKCGHSFDVSCID